MEIDADDTEPTHIRGGGGRRLQMSYVMLATSYDNHTVLGQSPKCHMSCLTTLYDNHTILDRPPQCHI